MPSCLDSLFGFLRLDSLFDLPVLPVLLVISVEVWVGKRISLLMIFGGFVRCSVAGWFTSFILAFDFWIFCADGCVRTSSFGLFRLRRCYRLSDVSFAFAFSLASVRPCRFSVPCLSVRLSSSSALFSLFLAPVARVDCSFIVLRLIHLFVTFVPFVSFDSFVVVSSRPSPLPVRAAAWTLCCQSCGGSVLWSFDVALLFACVSH
jgi:hypothetical protein